MAINSIGFIAFVVITCALYFVFSKKAKWFVLLASSYAFYWFSSNKLITYMLITTISIYLGALLLDKTEKTAKAKCKTIDNKDEKKKIKKQAKKRKNG